MPFRILIVDDEPELMEAYVKVLTKSGYLCLCASDGGQAIKTFDLAHPDLVLTDLNLATESGIEVIRHAHCHSPRTPIIAISGHAAGALFELAQACGASVCIQKPVDLSVLDAMVSAALAV